MVKQKGASRWDVGEIPNNDDKMRMKMEQEEVDGKNGYGSTASMQTNQGLTVRPIMREKKVYYPDDFIPKQKDEPGKLNNKTWMSTGV